MPDTGTLDRSTAVLQEIAPDVEPLTFMNARWAQITYEVAQQAAMSHLPPEVTRPIPCYARLFAIEGTLNGQPQSFAVLTVGGRHRMMARNIVVEAVSTAPALQQVVASGLHPGGASLTRDGGAVGIVIECEGRPLASVRLPAIYAIEPTMLRWDPWLGMGLQNGRAVLTEITVTPDTTAAYLSKAATVEMDAGLGRSHPWRRLRSLLTISACYAEGTLTFGAPQVTQELS